MTRILAGPYCTQILGDLGADVIKTEKPVGGDDTRAWGPPYAGDGTVGKESAYFLCVNRNKKSVGISFQHERGQQIFKDLASKSDVLVENYLPGTLARYGLSYEQLAKVNPGLVYVSITGFGQTGPYSKRAGYDVMVEAEFGLMHITGEKDRPPVKVGVAVTDLTTGLYASNAIMAALIARGKTGRGQHIDVALADCQVAMLANIASSTLISRDKKSERYGTAHPSIVPYQSFPTSDGMIVIGGGNDRQFAILCEKLGNPQWINDQRFLTNALRVKNRDILVHMIATTTKQKSTLEWLEILEESRLPYAPVNDIQTTLSHEHVKARGLVQTVKHSTCGPIKMVNTPVKYSESRPGIRLPPPTLGQHTEEVLVEILGMDPKDIQTLKEDGILS